MKADAVVIGGGIIGCSTAYYLARAGLNPVLVEKRGIGEDWQPDMRRMSCRLRNVLCSQRCCLLLQLRSGV